MRIFKERLFQLPFVVLGVTFVTFVMLNALSGDPAAAILGTEATPEAIRAIREELGLDRPFLIRYGDWLWGAVRGDLGSSYYNGRDVVDLIWGRLPVSAEIVFLAQVMALALALPIALLTVWRRNTWVDSGLGITAFAALSVPNFVLAIVLILVVSVQWNLLPATGFVPIGEGIGANLRTVLLPSLTLALSQYAVYMRLLRSEMMQNLGEAYVATAVAKGLSTPRVLLRHLMRNSLFSLITVLGVNVGTLIGGAVITETIFALPGLGRLLIDSIYQRDLMVVQGVVLLIALLYVLINLAVDVSYSLLDPRIRHGSTEQ